uniref:Uncharacterized protein n=1 Tax=Cucumis melo TaxID=3656 RepID=A0A9I9EJW6_CUCME
MLILHKMCFPFRSLKKSFDFFSLHCVCRFFCMVLKCAWIKALFEIVLLVGV